MSKTILLTGGTGLIGSKLADQLSSKGHKVKIVTRSERENRGNIQYIKWDVEKQEIDKEELKDVQVVIHLAGASVAKRWTKSHKKAIFDSRIKTANFLLKALTEQGVLLDAYIGASASGYYPRNTETTFSEEDVAGDDFLSEVCLKWEAAHHQFSSIAKRLVIHRIGVVMAKEGGALEPMMKPIKFGIAAYFGNGEQFYPWIHIDDLVSQFAFSVNQEIDGVYNANTDNVTQKNLNQAIAKAVGKSVISLPAPIPAIKLTMGEMHKIVTDSYKMSNQKIIDSGFQSQHPEVVAALADLFAKF